ncbi:MAG: flagellar biosynthesis anti-sigma factor FlgM [Rhodoferax sp.]|nr:flagellar biosynthesis anti-sigma factor FlgM [Betaproteobacteria bacterium]NCN98070.1 flagellar biosynthesis anti-sigma factor FlgM [Rhodoferax sp.]OIP22055.1 MAG: flagellar biosynthesis anti-sigma factor FlgM [Comamonadaceae bacterium CG2_30_57_122]PIZ21657.1 MAG: flagellar biosynthesis anti-sigma factor FlgM [Comamonadaceae bacterium CG_4_10_14_0_8_um_filter_57_29]PJC14173.1 MAG: flagellar biosynthesis anti-sigma factor FlgM [Comamonadaceae bacterium CG_4_9_14_0_8_um_filter_57_21]
MKINQSPDTSAALSSHAAALAAKTGPAASTLAKTSANKSIQSAGVAVSVSSLARSLEASNRGETPDVDTAKVEAVRNAIAQGTYAVNPEAIADKLLSNAQEMLTRSRV